MKIKQFKTEYCTRSRIHEYSLRVDIDGVIYGSTTHVEDFIAIPRHVILERLTVSIGREVSRNLLGMIA